MKKVVLSGIILAIVVFAGFKINQGLTLNVAPPVAEHNHEMAEAEDFQLAELNFTGKVHPALEIQANDIVEGNPNAPVTVIEYASMTCSHCASFNNTVMPKVRQNYIETGKVKFVMRDLAWDNMAKAIAIVSRCAPKEQHDMLVSAFFKTQSEWLKSTEPLNEIKKIARMAGMDSPTVDACIRNPKLNAEVEEMKRTATETLGVRGTPTIFVNGQRIDGVPPYSQIKKYIDAALEQTKAGGVHS